MIWPQYSLRTMLLAVAIGVPVLWFAVQFVRVDSQYVDPVTGSMRRTTKYWGLTTREEFEISPLTGWLADHGHGQPPQWQYIGSRSWNCYSCGYVPPVYYLRSAMPRVLELLSQDEMLALVHILRTGTYEEQMAAVEAIEKRL